MYKQEGCCADFFLGSTYTILISFLVSKNIDTWPHYLTFRGLRLYIITEFSVIFFLKSVKMYSHGSFSPNEQKYYELWFWILNMINFTDNMEKYRHYLSKNCNIHYLSALERNLSLAFLCFEVKMCQKIKLLQVFFVLSLPLCPSDIMKSLSCLWWLSDFTNVCIHCMAYIFW